MQKDNAIIMMLIVCRISRMLLKRYCDNQDVLDNIRMSLIDILILILLRMIFQLKSIEKITSRFFQI